MTTTTLTCAQEAAAATGVPLLEVKNLSKVFGPQPERAVELMNRGLTREEIFKQTGNMVAVHNVSLSVKAGEIFVVMGLSGSGKSTLVRLLNRLIEPTTGQVVLEGKDIAPMSAAELQAVRRRKMAMVFQSFALLPNRTVLDNVSYGLEVAGMKKVERYRIAEAALSRVGMNSYARLYPHELSGGMQQRVALARALAVNPTVLLMDEAFSALDPMIRSEMQHELLRLQQQEQRTIVFISHDIDEAIRIGGRIGIMKDGRLIQVGTPAELIQSPADDYVRDFFKHVDISQFLTASGLLENVDGQLIRCNGAAPAQDYLQQLIDSGRHCAYVCDEAGRYQGSVTQASLHKAGSGPIRDAFQPNIALVDLDTGLHALTQLALRQEHDLPVTDATGRLVGAVSCRTLLRSVMERRGA
jgi:glycine betaine/proline transport system ATP-binding protein